MPDEPKQPAPKQPWPFPFHILKEEWPEVKKAKFSFFLCTIVFLMVGGSAVFLLFNSFILPGKDATIEALKTKVEILNGTVPATTNAASQVKSEAVILADQLT